MKNMFKRTISVLTVALMLLCIVPFQSFAEAPEIWDGSIAEGFAGGTGTEADPYIVSNGSELAYLAQQVNLGVDNGGSDYTDEYIKMTADIYLNDTANCANWPEEVPANEWVAIGTAIERFYGVFDGDNHVVYGIYINKTGEATEDANQGLFGRTKGIIMNLGVEDSYVHGYDTVGAVVADNTDGAVINCYSTATVSGNFLDIGGVVGYSWGNVENCRNYGSVAGEVQAVGGVVGEIHGTISDCVNFGTVTGASTTGGVTGICDASISSCINYGEVSYKFAESIGGITGKLLGPAECCANFGTVKGDRSVAGIAGDSFDAITNCYNAGIIEGDELVGGIAGYFSSDYVVSCCYNAASITGDEDTHAVIGYTEGQGSNNYYLDTSYAVEDPVAAALTHEQLCAAENYAGFDFETIWTMEGDPDYPYAELICLLPEDEPAPLPDGDVDLNGSVTAGDALLALRFALEFETPTEDQILHGDMNGDGAFDTSDALSILRIAMAIDE